MDNIELIIGATIGLGTIAGFLIKVGRSQQKLSDDILHLKDLHKTVDVHSGAIQELKTEMASIRSTFQNIDLKIEHLTDSHEKTQAMIEQLREDHQQTSLQLIETIKSVTMKA